ncbi:MAG: hypothetical protein D6768_11260 [Chloroflexi bacterium]|nr:MAG: hypothetical protein D6768_11260 [Chloroflexota bacterium]
MIAAGLLANSTLLAALFSPDGELSRRSVLLIGLFDVALVGAGLVLVVSRSFATLFNVLVGLIFTLLLLWGLDRVLFYRLNHRPLPAASSSAEPAEPVPPPPHFEGSYTDNYFQDDPLLGYKPRPSAQVESIKKAGDEVIYHVTYTTDEFSRRVTPQSHPERRQKFILFFGDSFTFGEGVNDNETLPAYTAQLAPDYHAYNYGFSGYGPQQMLSKLQSGTLPAEIPQSDGIGVYVFIDAHVERAIGSMYVYNAWGADMPYYTVNWRGQLERRGTFRSGRPFISALYEGLAQTEFARYTHLNIPGTLRAQHYRLTAQIIAAARDEFSRQYPGSPFYVLVYPDEGDYFESINPYFEEFGLRILNYDEWLKLDVGQGTAFHGDGHPTGKAHRQVAGWLALDLGLADGK